MVYNDLIHKLIIPECVRYLAVASFKKLPIQAFSGSQPSRLPHQVGAPCHMFLSYILPDHIFKPSLRKQIITLLDST